MKSNERLYNASDYLELVQSIYIDACAKCPADVSDLRDLKTIRSRVKHEGMSFLTITLPAFCRAFENALSEGYIDPTWRSTLFRGFPFHGSGPAFLQGMIGLLFDYETGRIYDEKYVDYDLSSIVDCVRQICLTFKKLELGCTPEREAAAIESFIAIERDLNSFQLPSEDHDEFCRVSSVLWDNDVFRLRDCVVLPKHGPGATAERISGNGKYVWRFWHERLDNYFPFFDYGYITAAVDSKEFKDVSFIPETAEQPVRVTLVPKTLKAPRVIAIEPSCMQYAQQALRAVIYDMLESSPLSKGHVNFRDQSINQRLALIASKTGQLATIDLSDASDRVPWKLALEMFRACPEFRDAIDACRSTRAELPDGRIIGPLGKFASMGSALCFPIESMYFYTICVAALLRSRNLPVSRESCISVTREIYVYGDDIIIPAADAGTVLDYLQKYNCKVNTFKSFWTGRFRESCGVDAFAGTQVTPVYIRQLRPKNRQQVSGLISWSATANLFFKKGYHNTAELLHTVCEKILGVYPEVSEDSQALGRIYRIGHSRPRIRLSPKPKTFPKLSLQNGRLWETHCQNDYQRPEVRAWYPTPVYRTDQIEGYAALQKSLLRLGLRKEAPVVRNVLLVRASLDPRFLFGESDDPEHLERSALYRAVALKLGWVVAS